jgi:hypothetical protein
MHCRHLDMLKLNDSAGGSRRRLLWCRRRKMIPVDVQRMMAKRAGAKTVDEAGSHAIYVSKPAAVAKLIEQAAANVHRD